MQVTQAPINGGGACDRIVLSPTGDQGSPPTMSGALLHGGLERGLQELASLPVRRGGCFGACPSAGGIARWHFKPGPAAAAAVPLRPAHLPCPPAPAHHPQAAGVEATMQNLLRPTPVPGAPNGPLPALATLPPAAHLNLLLLLRAAPHRFTTAQGAALLPGLQRVAAARSGSSDPQHASLVQLLAAEAEGSLRAAAVPPCPPFLYTAQPCFPWAPVLTDAATAAALHKRQLKEARRREQVEQQAQQASDGVAAPVAAAAAAAAAAGKRPAEDGQGAAAAAKRPRPAGPPAAAITTAGAAAAADAELDAAAAAVKAALAAHAAGGAGELTAVTPVLRAALDVLLLHAAAGGAAGGEALEEAGLSSLTDDSLLLLLLSDLVSAASSFARCKAAAAGLLLPRLAALAGPAPRDLAAATQHGGGCRGCVVEFGQRGCTAGECRPSWMAAGCPVWSRPTTLPTGNSRPQPFTVFNCPVPCPSLQPRPTPRPSSQPACARC